MTTAQKTKPVKKPAAKSSARPRAKQASKPKAAPIKRWIGLHVAVEFIKNFLQAG